MTDNVRSLADESVLPVVLDKLTGLLTRQSLRELLKTAEGSREQSSMAILAVEISRFGVVNVSVGPETADRIIASIARRLAKLFPYARYIGRLHGDHFGIVFDRYDQLDTDIERLLDFARRPLAIKGDIVVLSVRVGVAHAGMGLQQADELLQAAEAALHQSKANMTQLVYFDPSMFDKARSVHQLENDLRVSLFTNELDLHSAVRNSEFILFYQPVIESLSGRLHGFEALLRWNHPKRGYVSPSEFIPLAEQIHVMTILGNWVIRKAIADAMTWQATASGMLPGVSINLSAVQFAEADILIATLRDALSQSGIAPERVTLEITESAQFSPSIRPLLEDLRALGCQLALDDFGTGYSAIGLLAELPVNFVKIDRSSVCDLGHPDPKRAERAQRVTRAIIGLADSLGITTIVEGIETEPDLAVVQQLGADLLQGYVYSQPLPPDMVNGFIAGRGKQMG